jgi:hypothetical protein
MSIEASIPRHKINTIAFSAVGFICPLFGLKPNYLMQRSIRCSACL